VVTWSASDRFQKDFAALSAGERAAFRHAVEKMVDDMKDGGPFRKGLRIKGVKAANGIFEVTWADDGRATFEYGAQRREGQPHIVWRRIGHHNVFGSP
jgi:hypothetical protein